MTTVIAKPQLKKGVLILLLAFALAGCGGGSEIERFPMTGAVTFEGQPVVYGAISFHPDQSQGNSGPVGEAEIVDGHYDTAVAGGQSVVGGQLIARITAYPSRPVEAADELAALETEAVAPLFVDYAMPCEYIGAPWDFDVPAEAKGHDPYAPKAR